MSCRLASLVSWQETVKTLEANSDSRRGWKIIHTLVQCSATVFFGYIARGCNVRGAVRREPEVQSPFSLMDYETLQISPRYLDVL